MTCPHNQNPCIICWMMYPLKFNTTPLYEISDRFKKWNSNNWSIRKGKKKK
jgi:hypothetical protein